MLVPMLSLRSVPAVIKGGAATDAVREAVVVAIEDQVVACPACGLEVALVKDEVAARDVHGERRPVPQLVGVQGVEGEQRAEEGRGSRHLRHLRRHEGQDRRGRDRRGEEGDNEAAARA